MCSAEHGEATEGLAEESNILCKFEIHPVLAEVAKSFFLERHLHYCDELLLPLLNLLVFAGVVVQTLIGIIFPSDGREIYRPIIMGHTDDTIAARRQLTIQARVGESVYKVAMRENNELHLVPFCKSSPMPHRHRDVEHRL
jgi:hypothetical protein